MTADLWAEERICVYCGLPSAGDLPRSCPHCGAHLTIAVGPRTKVRDLARAVAGNQAAVRFRFEKIEESNDER